MMSGFDSDVTGFDSESLQDTAKSSTVTQTTTIQNKNTNSQTSTKQETGSQANLKFRTDVNFDNLNGFLRKVMPGLMTQLDINMETASDSDEETFAAKKLQMIRNNTLESGDKADVVLSLSFNKTGNSIAASIGQKLHEEWCEHNSTLKIFNAKRMENFTKYLEIQQKTCITVAAYNPDVAALIAYGTSLGDIVISDLSDVKTGVYDNNLAYVIHGYESTRITDIKWADFNMTSVFATIHINETRKRRVASDMFLITAAGEIIKVWLVNMSSKSHANVITYDFGKVHEFEISCFDFTRMRKTTGNEQIIVGSSTGSLRLCQIKDYKATSLEDAKVLNNHNTCVLAIASTSLKSGIFVSISMDSEIRLYTVSEEAPIKIICVDEPISSLCWLKQEPLVAVGLANVSKGQDMIKLYNPFTGDNTEMEGLINDKDNAVTVTCLDIGFNYRLAAGDSDSDVHIWEIPQRLPRNTNRASLDD